MSLSERESIWRDLDPPFTVHRPTELSSPLVFCSPHSGRVYPRSFIAQSQLTPAELRKSEDCFVEELFGSAPDHGAFLIEAHFPRAYLDLNREPFELDPELFAEPLPDYANTRTMRVIGGLGTIARIVSEREEIYAEPLPLEDALERIEQLYRPFHYALTETLNEVRDTFGFAILVDCHSMPSGETPSQIAARPDFVLGDRFGSSCDSRITRLLRQHLTQQGYRVQLNRPYAGGYITEHYGQPFAQQHSIQIEINRALYLDEATFQRNSGFSGLREKMSALVALLSDRVPRFFPPRAAAE